MTASGRLSPWVVTTFEYFRRGQTALRFRFLPTVITVAISWYVRSALSYRDVDELLAERRSRWITS
jgi:transposase-like protein